MRYYNQKIFSNEDPAYKKYLKNRGMNKIIQYDTPKFVHPTAEDAANFSTVNHIWKTGDRFFKLAHKYYEDATKWWVIALYNQKPTEFEVSLGETVYVPVPLDVVMYYMGY